MSPCTSSPSLQYCLLILLRIASIAIICNINHPNGGGILLAVAQNQPPLTPAPTSTPTPATTTPTPSSPTPSHDHRSGGIVGGGGRTQQVVSCFTGCSQDIVGCGVTCTLGSSRRMEHCFMSCGFSSLVCMNSCIQLAISDQEGDFNLSSNPDSVPIH
ncbi:hypothetical protein QVD17_09558 [Tagetes erecta]|uniref:Uncharacterized protein n=1 Tax=Tagetes erecta TaxID=13708 RepID=A0AAD8NYL6_TARER|nr:hypothetical protein QVD17_09558 [Tagetes erecta]